MPPVHIHRDSDTGLVMALGAHPTPHNPESRKYELFRTLTGTPDLSQSRSVVTATIDPRLAPDDPDGGQGAEGACTCYATMKAQHVLMRLAGKTPPRLSAPELYVRCRQHDGYFPEDSGEFAKNVIDYAMAHGIALVADAPWTDNPTQDYPASADAHNVTFIGGHRPFYATNDPQDLAKGVWLALDAGEPVTFCVNWANSWFNPGTTGIVPAPNQFAGGHMFDVETIIPGYYVCTNHWNQGRSYWNPQAQSFGHNARPGDFIIPWSYGVASIVTEADSISPVAVQPNPPQPAAKTLNDWIGPWRDTVADPTVDLDEVEMRDWQGSWMDWANGATVMKPGYQLPPPALPRGRR